MCEFFGKRGLSWHISAVVTKKDSRIEVECFVHIFKFCIETEKLRNGQPFNNISGLYSSADTTVSNPC